MTDIHKVFNGLYTPFFRTFFQSALLSEPKGSAIASKAPIPLCSPVIGGQKPYKQIDEA
jgi:hypothetical protein